MNRSNEAGSGRIRMRWLWVPSCLVLALALAACNAGQGQLAESAPASVHVAARPGVSPRGAPVALASVEGAPPDVARRFADQTRDHAAGLDVVLTDMHDAKYLVRSYLSAEPTAGGAVVAYVLDIFDAHKARVQRVADAVTVKSGGADPWSGVDDAALGQLATKSAADLAAVLSNMPEAVAAAGSAPVAAADAGAAAGRTAGLMTTAAGFR